MAPRVEPRQQTSRKLLAYPHETVIHTKAFTEGRVLVVAINLRVLLAACHPGTLNRVRWIDLVFGGSLRLSNRDLNTWLCATWLL